MGERFSLREYGEGSVDCLWWIEVVFYLTWGFLDVDFHGMKIVFVYTEGNEREIIIMRYQRV